MKLLLLPLLLFSLITAQELSVKHMTGHAATDVQSLRPYIQLINDGVDAVDIGEMAVEYYIYEKGVTAENLTWEYYHSNMGEVYSINFYDLDKNYDLDGRKANIRCEITFNSAVALQAGEYIEMRHGIFPPSWNPDFLQGDDWSFSANQNYVYNENIVVRNIQTGEVIYGTDPVGTVTPRPYSVVINWLGKHTLADFTDVDLREGDAYLNTDDNIAYVYYHSAWTVISENGTKSVKANRLNASDGKGGWKNTDIAVIGGEGAAITNLISSNKMTIYAGAGGSSDLGLAGDRVILGASPQFAGSKVILVDNSDGNGAITAPYYNINEINAAGDKSITTKEYVDSKVASIPAGPQGPKGDAGPRGAQGIQGVQGNQGLRGYTGPMGPQGPAGSGGTAGPVSYTTLSSAKSVTSSNTKVLELTINAPTAGHIIVNVTGLYGTHSSYSDEQRGLESFITLNSTNGGNISEFGEKMNMNSSAQYINKTKGFPVSQGSNTIRLIVSPRTTLSNTIYKVAECDMTVTFSPNKM